MSGLLKIREEKDNNFMDRKNVLTLVKKIDRCVYTFI